MTLTDRSTADLVVLIFAGALAVVILLVGGGLFVLLAVDHSRDYTVAINTFGNLIGAFAGVVLGYLAGRGRRQTGGLTDD